MTLASRLQQIQSKIHAAEISAQRPTGSVRLLAVSKTQPASLIREAYNLGLNQFGENYWQESKEKMNNLTDLPITWHFIGPLQSNKAKDIAEHFDWIHSLCREKIAHILDQSRPAHLPPLQICIQVNLLEETNKSGISLKTLPQLVETVLALKHLQLRGLMFIPPQDLNKTELLAAFHAIKELKAELNQRYGLDLDTLSMGMSEDLTEAIQEGSTLVRVGRGLFGERIR